MRFERLHRDFGVEVLDYDPRDDSSPEEIAELRCALDEHHMLLFRGGPRLSPDQHLEISRRFGPACDGGGGDLVGVLHNDEPAGSRRLPFHSDFTYTDDPLPIISLHAIELPAGGTATAYVSSAAAWSRLDDASQAKLAALTIRHDHTSYVGYDWPDFSAKHPLRFPHPRTGRPILLITEYHAARIEELSAEDSERTLKDLFAGMYDPKGIYVHRWRLNDLLIWDNIALQHARPVESLPADGARAMQRVQIGTVGFPELIERARHQQAERERSEAATAH